MSKPELKWPKGQSRYRVLADQLESQIQRKIYKIGDYLPTEGQLSEMYSVSRFTVRQAIKELQSRGLILTHHGKGSEVSSPKSTDPEFSFSFESVDDFIGAARTLRLIIDGSDERSTDELTSEILECDVGEPYMLFDGLRVIQKTDEPVASVELLVPKQYAGIHAVLGHKKSPVSSMMERRYKLRTAQINQTIEPIALSSKTAKRLNAKIRSPAILVCRTYIDALRGVFLHVRNIHSGKYARLSMKIQRKSSSFS